MKNFALDIEDQSLLTGLELLRTRFPFALGGGRPLVARKGEGPLKLWTEDGVIRMTYPTRHKFYFGFSYCLQWYDRSEFSLELSGNPKLGIMRDCARNATLSVSGICELVLSAALLGYDRVGLYLEDLLEMEDAPYFGHARGRYSRAELREADDYARALGVELVPFVQTLAHLPAIFRHDTYLDVQDLEDVLLVGEPKTYALIEKILTFVSETFSTRNVNIGMDEAYRMGYGQYLKRNGSVPDRGELFLAHLERVCDICRKLGLHPSIWSDMVFKTGLGTHNHVGYSEVEGKHFSETIRPGKTQDITQVIWDYYHADRKFYDEIFERHFELTDRVAFAGGVWSWFGFNALNSLAEQNLLPALKSCRDNGCDDIFLTAWGDGGGECSAFLAISSYQFAAHAVLGLGMERETLNARSEFLFGNTYEEFRATENVNAMGPGSLERATEAGHSINVSHYVLYNDPLIGILDAHCYPEQSAYFVRNAREMESYARKGGRYAYLFDTLAALASVCAEKAMLGVECKAAYDAGDRAKLKELAEIRFPTCAEGIRRFYEKYKCQWMRENKAFGFEITDMRIGAVLFRLEQGTARLKSWIAGEIARIEELEQPRIPVCTFMEPGEDMNYHSFSWAMSGSNL